MSSLCFSGIPKINACGGSVEITGEPIGRVRYNVDEFSVQLVNKVRAPLEKSKNRERCFFRFVTSVGLRKICESPWGIRVPMLYHWATETPRWARSITKFIGHACVCRLSSHTWKTWSMSCSLIPEVRHTFSFLSFFISFLSGNKLRYLPQGIFKGLKQLLTL